MIHFIRERARPQQLTGMLEAIEVYVKLEARVWAERVLEMLGMLSEKEAAE